MGHVLIALISLSCSTFQALAFHVDPSDYFLGAQHRPKLEIIQPENGQIFDDVNVQINAKITGYNIPSSFHDSNICIFLAAGNGLAEQCFAPTPDLIFHANGLSPGSHYSLRISLFERGNVIAVSVRTFRVGGIIGILDGSDAPVTIHTAVQVAIHFQTHSMIGQAESIYRRILNEGAL